MKWIGLDPITVFPCFFPLYNFYINRLLLTNVDAVTPYCAFLQTSIVYDWTASFTRQYAL